MTTQQIALRDRVRSITLADVNGDLVTVAEQFMASWAGDSTAAKESLLEMGVNGEFGHMLGLAIDSAERRHQRQLNYELDGYRVRRTCFQVA